MIARASARRSEGVLDEAGGFGAMTWIMAIMLFLTLLAAALGLGTAGAARLLTRDLAGRMTVQLVDGDPAVRDATARRIAEALGALPQVTGVEPVDRAELARLLRPWLGEDGTDPALPVPVLIDISLKDDGGAAAAHAADAVRRIAPTARIDEHGRWMAPVSALMRSVTLLALGLVLLMASATAAVVVLAARSGLHTHRATIEVMHMLGSTDVQVARLFQRRIAIDAAIGSVIGGSAALAIVALAQNQLAGLGSELAGGAAFAWRDWLLLAFLPLLFVGLATLAARMAVLRTLGRIL